MSNLEHSHGNSHKVSAAALLITLGIIYGDIGTLAFVCNARYCWRRYYQ
ncbi:MAG: hypothetical protein KatS3mg035_0892 [Bacteroidia bacterium]|nr:MAG: hypothetical protein KatS3mg035_0892 [Bacteroidia bacterium]